MNFYHLEMSLKRAIGSRWPEVRANLRWIVDSWLRPPDAAAGWEQGPDRKP